MLLLGCYAQNEDGSTKEATNAEADTAADGADPTGAAEGGIDVRVPGVDVNVGKDGGVGVSAPNVDVDTKSTKDE